MGRNMRIMFFTICLFSLALSDHAFAQRPDTSFLRSKMMCGDGYTYVGEFVSQGLKPGKWAKTSKGKWVYTNVEVDDLLGTIRNKTIIQFAKKNNNVFVERWISSGYEDTRRWNMVCGELPTYKKTRAEYYVRKAEEDRVKLIKDNFRYYFPRALGKYEYTETYGNSNAHKIIEIKSITENVADFDFISEQGSRQVCSVSVKNAIVTQSDGQHSHIFTIVSQDPEEDSCRIRLTASVPSIDYDYPDSYQTQVEINYKGDCDDLCDFSDINMPEEFLPSGKFFTDVKLAEKVEALKKAQKVEEWK